MTTDFALVGGALSSPARSAMLNALLDGTPVSAGELARIAQVRPSTASAHLAALVRSGLVRGVRSGRQHRFALANADVAGALEVLARISPQVTPRSLRQSLEADAFRLARMCYDHLAGRIGVGLLDRLTAIAWLSSSEAGFDVTEAGEEGLASIGVEVDAARHARRAFAWPCLDVTERRPHLAGALGAALAAAMFDQGWLERWTGTRAIRVTPEGRAGLATNLSLPEDETSP